MHSCWKERHKRIRHRVTPRARRGLPKAVSRPTSARCHHVTLRLGPQFLICTEKGVRAGGWFFVGICIRITWKAVSKWQRPLHQFCCPPPGKAPRKNSEVVNRANPEGSLPGWTTVPGDRSFHPHSQRGYKWNNHSSQTPPWRCTNRNFFKRCVFVHPVVTQSSSSPSVVHQCLGDPLRVPIMSKLFLLIAYSNWMTL